MVELYSAPKIRLFKYCYVTSYCFKLFLFFPHSDEQETCDGTESAKKVTCWRYSSSNIRFILYRGIQLDCRYTLLIVCFVLTYAVRFRVRSGYHFLLSKTAGHLSCVLHLSINTAAELKCYAVSTASGILSWAISWVKTKASRHCWLALLGFHALEAAVDCRGLCLVEVQGYFF